MQTLLTSVLHRFRRFSIGATTALCVALAASLHAADGSRYRFDLPAGPADAALKQFSAQSGQQVVAPTALVQGVRTQEVRGEISAREALDRMLSGTGLAARLDDQSGAFAVVRSNPPSTSAEKKAPTLAEVTAAARASTETAGTGSEAAISLSPFVVKSDADVGYLAGNTLAGSRLNTPLRDTAASINVLTSEFMSDIGALSLSDLYNWTVNSTDEITSQQSNDNNYFFSPQGDGGRTRGIQLTRTRNYFTWIGPSDTYNIDRVEDARGPNSVLFGIGSAGGVLNVSTKVPLARNFLRLSGMTDTNGSIRGTIDANQSVLNKRLGIRFNAVYSDRDDDQKLFAFERNLAATLAVSYTLDDKTRLRGEYEGGRRNRVFSRPNLPWDRLGIWVANGRQMVDGSATLTTAQQAAAGVTRLAAADRVTYTDDHSNAGAAGILFNNRNLYVSNGSGINFADKSWAADEVNTGGPGQIFKDRFNAVMFSLERQLGKDTFLEFAYNHQDQQLLNYKSFQQGEASLRIDPNRTLADGSPNPYAGRLFVEGEWAVFLGGRRDDDTRLSLNSEFDFGKWGNYRLAGMAQHHWYVDHGGVLVEVWDGRPFGGNAEQTSNLVWRRSYLQNGNWSSYYLSSPAFQPIVSMKDPVTGNTLTSSWVSASANWRDDPSYQETVLLGLQARYFKNRLVIGTGLRRDWLKVHDLQAPRNPASLAFELDRNGAIAKPIDSRYKGVTKTLGAVYHVNRVISLFYNVSNNFALPNTSLIIIPDAHTPDNSINEGKDYGIAAELLGGRLYAKLNYYEVHARSTANIFGATANMPKLLNDRIIGGLLAAGAITQQEYDSRIMKTASAGTLDFETSGYEFSLVGNLTKNWRLTSSYSYTDGQYASYGPEIIAWWNSIKDYYAKFDQTTPSTAGIPIGQEISEWRRLYYDPHTLVTQAKGFRGNRRDKVTFYNNYRITTGALRGLSLGGGYRFQSKQNIGNYTDKTIKYGSSFWTTNATIGYSLPRVPEFLRIKSLSFQLNVENATNNRKPIIRNYDVLGAGTARDPIQIYGVTIPAPRAFRFSTTAEF